MKRNVGSALDLIKVNLTTYKEVKIDKQHTVAHKRGGTQSRKLMPMYWDNDYIKG